MLKPAKQALKTSVPLITFEDACLHKLVKLLARQAAREFYILQPSRPLVDKRNRSDSTD